MCMLNIPSFLKLLCKTLKMPANIKRIVSKQVTIKLNMSDTVTPSIGKKKMISTKE